MTGLVPFAETVKYVRQNKTININNIFHIYCCNIQYKDYLAYIFEGICILIKEK